MFYTKKNFITSNIYQEGSPRYNFYAFDIRIQEYSSAQPTRLGFDFSPADPAATNLIGNDLLLTNFKKSNNSDGQKRFDLI